ncbi:MAG: M48 family metalloprotease [Rhodothermaceae bacterium]|nr:M48 family metalloprotease [Rhodothermaceae bacterium]
MYSILRSLQIRLFTGMLILTFGVNSCMSIQKNPVTGQKRAFAYSWQQEVEIGQQADGEVVEYFGIYDDAELSAYLTAIGERVLAESHLRRPDADRQFRETPFTFRVVDSPVVNAFALPGGFVYFTRGIIAHMNNEAQLAMVMGHEIGHVAARHSSQRALTQQAGQFLLIGGAIIGQEALGIPAGNIMQLGGTAAQLLFLSYSRDAERESDKLGVEYSALAGYAAGDGSAFFRVIQRVSDKGGGGSLPFYLSSHPDPGDREAAVESMAQEWREKGTDMDYRGRDEYLAKIDGIIIGENPRNGFVDNNVYYHPDLKFRFSVPAGWMLQNDRSQVVTYTESQDGVQIMNIDSEASSARQTVDKVLGSEGITMTDRSDLRINGLVAHRAMADASDQQGNPLKVVLHGIEYDGRVYRIISYTTAARYQTYLPAFISQSESFNTLTDPARLNVQPSKIRIVTADRNAPFRQFLPSKLPMGMDAEDLAIINQVELDTQIQRGQKIKIPR